MGTEKYFCPSCYCNRYNDLTLRKSAMDGTDAFRCERCMELHTQTSWIAMREDCPTNEWIQEAYSQERFDKVIKNLHKRGFEYDTIMG